VSQCPPGDGVLGNGMMDNPNGHDTQSLAPSGGENLVYFDRGKKKEGRKQKCKSLILVLSLPSHRHSYIGFIIIFSFRFIDS
jgi:hypothetical protein